VVQLCIVVADTGIGIAAAVLPLLFKPFVQADGSISRTYGGSGLGLTIVKQLCELMGGSVTLSSIEGTGSTVTVIIVAEVVHTDEPAPDAGDDRDSGPDVPTAPDAPADRAAPASASAADLAALGPATGTRAGSAVESPAGTAVGPATGAAPGTVKEAVTRSATGRWTA
jgi:hypothetical protein